MPTYEYLCQTCSHRFEQRQKMTDDPLETCPECGGHIRRVYFPAGIVFKGSGFYKTDHRNASGAENGNGNGHAAKGKEAATSGGEKTAGESKPAATETGSGTPAGTGEKKGPTATSTVAK